MLALCFYVFRRHLQYFRPHAYFFDSLFYSALSGPTVDHIAAWNRSHDIFDYEFIVFPVNLGHQHWVLFIARVQFFSVTLYDSSPSSFDVDPYFRHLCDYLADEHVRKGRGPSQWARAPSPPCALQTLPGDCGPFICLYAYLITAHQPPLIPSDRVVDIRCWVMDILMPYTRSVPPRVCLPPWYLQVRAGIIAVGLA